MSKKRSTNNVFNFRKTRWYKHLFFTLSCLSMLGFAFMLSGTIHAAVHDYQNLSLLIPITECLFLATIVFICLFFASHPKKTVGTMHSGESTAKKTNHEEETDVAEDAKTENLIWQFDAFIRDFYQSLPLDEFYVSHQEIDYINERLVWGKLTGDDLKPVVNKMIKHLGQKFNYASIEVKWVGFNNTNLAGYARNKNRCIVINYHEGMDARNILSTLVHEMSHIYQFYEHHQYPGDEKESEMFTDCLAVYLGFGKILLDGKKFSHCIGRTQYSCVLGYLDRHCLKTAITAARARKEMKEIIKDNKSELLDIENKATQLVMIFQQYSSSIDLIIAALKTRPNITSGDYDSITTLIMKYSHISENKVTFILKDIQKCSSIEQANDKMKNLNDELTKLALLYFSFSEIYKKYCEDSCS